MEESTPGDLGRETLLKLKAGPFHATVNLFSVGPVKHR